MIKQMLFLRWCSAHRIPATRDGKLTTYGKRVFAVWERHIYTP